MKKVRKKMYQCPYERACQCIMTDGCVECETFGEYLNGNTIPVIQIKSYYKEKLIKDEEQLFFEIDKLNKEGFRLGAIKLHFEFYGRKSLKESKKICDERYYKNL